MKWQIGLLTVLMILTGCNQDGNSSSDNVQPVEKRVEDLLAKMNLDEKIGQMTQVDRKFLKDTNDIQKYFLGSLLSGGGSAPDVNAPENWADMIDGYQKIALGTRLAIPLIYGIDAVHGNSNVYGAVIFPHNIGLGCTGNPALVEEAMRVTAEEVAGTGINWNFAPCVAVPRDERWGRTYEGFGETPELVKQMGGFAVRGLQGTNLDNAGSILACAKHFIGDGGTAGGVDQGDTQLDQETLFNIHLQGYLSALEHNVGSIMISFSSWNGQKMHGHDYLINSVLRGQLGFDGLIVSDWAGIDQLPGDYKNDIRESILAGIDMIMVPENYEAFLTNLKALVEEGSIPMARIDASVRRILKIKFKMGLFENPYADRSYTASIGSEAHRQVARTAVQQSQVLLKNETNTLPLAKTVKRIHVAGKNADDLGNQCGGWTISWQGSSGDITVGTTILQGIKNTVSPSTNVTYSLDGSGANGADIGVVVIGESPYAEGMGDRTDLSLSDEDIQAVQNLKKTGIPTVVILVSGRPMIITPVMEASDAFIAAWLPGTEGQGVADVLFGDVKPTGKLSHSWPRNMEQIPINYGDTEYDPLFSYGYGLTYP